MKRPILAAAVGAGCLLTGCAGGGSVQKSEVQEFLRMYNEVSPRVRTVAAQAEWQAATDVTEENTGQSIGAQRAAALADALSNTTGPVIVPEIGGAVGDPTAGTGATSPSGGA